MPLLTPSHSITTNIYLSLLIQLIIKMRRFKWTLSTLPSEDCFEWKDLGEPYELEKRWKNCRFIISSDYELLYREDKDTKQKKNGIWIQKWINNIPVKSVRNFFMSTLEMFKQTPPTITYLFRVCNHEFMEWEEDWEDVFKNVITVEYY